jgi:hypothetical protein
MAPRGELVAAPFVGRFGASRAPPVKLVQIPMECRMKQLFLAIALIIAPVAAFTGFEVYAKSTATSVGSLGDMSPFKVIIADVQAMAAKGDLPAAAKRITDYESAWDEAETAIRPLNPTYWGNVDAASDAALKALRQATPSIDKVNKTLLRLMMVLNDPSQPAS